MGPTARRQAGNVSVLRGAASEGGRGRAQRWLIGRPRAKTEEKSVGYNCCHRSQMCPGKLAYIHSSAAGRRTKGAGWAIGVGGTSPPPSSVPLAGASSSVIHFI